MRTSLTSLVALCLLAAACGRGGAQQSSNPPLTPAESNGPATGAAPPPTLAPMLAKVSAAVVNISVEGTMKVDNPLFQDPLFRRFFNLPQGSATERFQAVGSGVIIDAAHGYIITNNHVVENASKILVTLLDHRQITARLVAADPQSDVAVLRVSVDHLTAMPIGDSQKLRVGDYVVAIGDPFGVGQTATFGIVSALGRTGLGIEGYEDFIQTDASINPGNSGGALVDLSGRLIGMNTAILSRSGGNVGIGFAIPIDMVQHVAMELVAHGKVSRGELGVVIQTLTPELAQAMHINANTGALVADVQPGSPADKAGIRAGDVVTALNGHPIRDSSDLRNEVGAMGPGNTAHLTILREGHQVTLDATLEPQSAQTANNGKGQNAPNEPPTLGLQLTPIPGDSPLKGQVQGAYVASVEPGSPAEQAGLQQGDVITEVGGAPVDNVQAATRALRGRPPNKPVLLRIRRENQSLFVAIE